MKEVHCWFGLMWKSAVFSCHS